MVGLPREPSRPVLERLLALHIALYRPEIPPNTGNVGRLCVGVGAVLHVIHPIGFSMSAKAVRRAGLDYWKHVEVHEHADGEAFWAWAGERKVHLFSSHGAEPHTACPAADGDVLLFGPESVGLPTEWVERRGAYRIPLWGPVRSLNLSNAVAVATYAALQRIEPERFA